MGGGGTWVGDGKLDARSKGAGLRRAGRKKEPVETKAHQSLKRVTCGAYRCYQRGGEKGGKAGT